MTWGNAYVKMLKAKNNHDAKLSIYYRNYVKIHIHRLEGNS